MVFFASAQYSGSDRVWLLTLVKPEIKRAELIVSSELVDETVMMNVEKGAYYGLDDIETKLWQIIETPTSVSALCDSLLAHYDVAREQGETDVLTFLNELHAEGIIEVVEAG